MSQATGVVAPERIVLKINLCEYRMPESGAVTDPQLLELLIVALKELYADVPITIVENDATTLDATAAFRYLGIDSVARRTGAELLTLSGASWRPVPVRGGLVFRDLDLPDLLGPGCLYVNFAKLKINSGSLITGCLKNNYALLRQKRKAHLHNRVHRAVRDINVALADTGVRTFGLIDGYIGMETVGGPAFGRPRKCELLLASHDTLALDTCEARVMGIPPVLVGHLRLCAAAGIGSRRYTLVTDIPDFAYRKYRFRFDWLEFLLRTLLRGRAGVAA